MSASSAKSNVVAHSNVERYQLSLSIMSAYYQRASASIHPFASTGVDIALIQVREFRLIPNIGLQLESMNSVPQDLMIYDLGECARVDSQAITKLLNLRLESRNERIDEEELRELRAIVSIGQNQLLLQNEPSKPKTKKQLPRRETSASQPNQLSFLSLEFNSEEKTQIGELTRTFCFLTSEQLVQEIESSDPIKRSAGIRANALLRAKGKCESCNSPAPFETLDGPYLEGHHIEKLADGGADSVDNVIALCPNCHRKAHYSVQSNDFKVELKKNLDFIRVARNSLIA